MTTPLRLDRREGLPAALAELTPRDIRQAFATPTLIDVEGRRGAPLFLSVLLHGNETVGFYVLQNLARRFAAAPPPRPLLIFVGNVEAAEMGLRLIPGGRDFNRVWAGGEFPEAALAAEVIAAARAAAPFASVDIHNNTGANPHYGCVNALKPQNLQLASLFSRICVYYTNPKTTQSMAFSEICPAVTIECGRPGETEGVERAVQFVLDVLHLDHLDSASHAARDLEVFHTLGRILIDPGTDFSFAPGAAPLSFAPDFERLNFSALPAGAEIARAETPKNPLHVVDEEGRDLTGDFLTLENGSIRLTRPATPAMLTPDDTIIRQDCLGYLMEELSPAEFGA